MRLHEIENWALEVIDQVNSGQPIEDSRVELKAEWIDHYKAARRIAGHANAARGAPILWLIGVDEKQGVKGVKHEDLADWFSQVISQFDGITPLMQDINLRVNDETVVALSFETERAPFVVKNPNYGQPGGGKIAREVPWREATSVRSAKREELIRILSPLQSLPKFEVLEAYLNLAHPQPKDKFWWYLKLELYVEPTSAERVAIPFHRCKVECQLPVIGWKSFGEIEIHAPHIPGVGVISDTVVKTPDEVLISGPGRIELDADTATEVFDYTGSFDVEVPVSVALSISNIEPVIKLDNLFLPPANPEAGNVYRWDINPKPILAK